ncbi:hydroxyethylthiazole kinase [Sporomusaceae bacterium FL31]|nr:hydroxyethylthiazole kinase [Sporomusaceae bacterium FL31]GCE35872.1 hydroxyethylthiazole kinase [Sporomusaceae bacterium]
MLNGIYEILDKIKQQRPLIHHITNYVTANDSANITLALGASPVMASEIKEVEEMAGHAAALVLNIGTLSSQTVEAMVAAGRKAAANGIPVVFDPVGVGATAYRTETAERIIREVKPTVIRGNMSEINVLSGLHGKSKGVDSVADETDAESIAVQLANKLACVIAVTGKTDVITNGKQVVRLENGHVMLTQVTGTGCMTSSLVGSCCAVADPLAGAAAGIAIMGIAGEIAQQSLKLGEGIGTFRIKLFDAVSTLNDEILRSQIRFG